jgi:outer membrane protein assembly factor BamC
VRRALIVALALAVSGCTSIGGLFGGRGVDYKSAGQLPPLEVPPDLSPPPRDGRFAVPETRSSATLSGYQQERKQQVGQSTSGILPQVDKVRLERAGRERWLVVPESPEKVWPVVRAFWEDRGFVIDQAVPEAGVMETDWTENRPDVERGGIRGFLARAAGQLYSTGERDRFRTRLERAPDGRGTEVYISHRGMREVYTRQPVGGEPVQTAWEPREPDPGLEAQFLRLLMVRLGAHEEHAVAAITESAAEARAQIVKSSDGNELLLVKEPFDRAWRRVGLALDRVGFTVEDRDRQNGLYFVRYADPEGEAARKAGERGLFARLFGTGDPKVRAEQYRVQIRPDKETSVVDILDKDGGADASRTAQRILALLHEQLK